MLTGVWGTFCGGVRDGEGLGVDAGREGDELCNEEGALLLLYASSAARDVDVAPQAILEANKAPAAQSAGQRITAKPLDSCLWRVMQQGL
jgi:hypothetical protein